MNNPPLFCVNATRLTFFQHSRLHGWNIESDFPYGHLCCVGGGEDDHYYCIKQPLMQSFVEEGARGSKSPGRRRGCWPIFS
jgi:hypothetical protein